MKRVMCAVLLMAAGCQPWPPLTIPEGVTAGPPATAPPAPVPSSEGAGWGEGGTSSIAPALSDLLACIRSYEGDYTSVSPDGLYRGAYQFAASTGRGAVTRAGYGSYADDPADEWPPEVQDAAAAQLLSERGLQPWPPAGGC